MPTSTETLPDWLLELDAPAESAAIAKLPSRMAQLAGIKEIEASLLAKSLRVTEASLGFMDVDLEDLPGTKQRFIDEHGEAEGAARYRIALANWQTSKDAPAGLKNATSVTLAMLKIRNQAPPAPTHLNMTFVQMNTPPTEYQIPIEAITVDE